MPLDLGRTGATGLAVNTRRRGTNFGYGRRGYEDKPYIDFEGPFFNADGSPNFRPLPVGEDLPADNFAVRGALELGPTDPEGFLDNLEAMRFMGYEGWTFEQALSKLHFDPSAEDSAGAQDRLFEFWSEGADAARQRFGR